MKSFLYEIPHTSIPMHPYSGPFRIKVWYDGPEWKELNHEPDLLLMGVDWFGIYKDIHMEVLRLWEQAKANVDITPGDGCPHSDQMINE